MRISIVVDLIEIPPKWYKNTFPAAFSQILLGFVHLMIVILTGGR
jgi:hypothetical protein